MSERHHVHVSSLAAMLLLLPASFAGAPPAVGAETVLYSFAGPPSDGSEPDGNLVMDKSGNLYGTTFRGGSSGGSCPSANGSGCGTAFELPTNGSERVLYAFCPTTGTPCTDGANPVGNVAIDAAGNIYGATEYGGATCQSCGTGTVFKVAPAGAETVLYAFCPSGPPCNDGFAPNGGVIIDKSGNLYGTTVFGGTKGGGVVFRLRADGKEKVLHAFCNSNCTDGYNPLAGLFRDGSGNLFGVTELGGSDTSCNNGTGCGTVFEIAASGAYKTLYSFTGGTDGAFPVGGVIKDKAGNVYGTTSEGGSCDLSRGCGTVFKIAANGAKSTLYTFRDGTDGDLPQGNLILDSKGKLYGTTYYGGGGSHAGSLGGGTVFALTASGKETVLYAFCNLEFCNDGADPAAGVILRNGILYGMTFGGGVSGQGAIFSLPK